MFVASIFGYGEYIEINAFITGAFSIGIISGAYSTEVFRGAIQSIDKGKFEAAKVLGISKFAQFYKIILPQMLRLAIPNLNNVWQITLKDTSLISVTVIVCDPDVIEKGLFFNNTATAGSILSGLTFLKDIESPFIGFVSYCGCFGSNSEI